MLDDPDRECLITEGSIFIFSSTVVSFRKMKRGHNNVSALYKSSFHQTTSGFTVTRTLIKDLPGCIDQETIIKGFVETIRDQRFVQFVTIRDASGAVQIVNEKTPENEARSALISQLTVGSTAAFTGKIVTAPKVKLGGLELQLRDINVYTWAKSPLPISADSSFDKKIDQRALSLRFPDQQLIYKVQTTMVAAMHEFWANNDFTIMYSPKLMETASESGAEVFKVDYFNRDAFLAQSPQFYKQMGVAGGIERYAEIGPVFRADPSSTPRHNSEFISVDMEMAWVDSHEDVMAMEEQFLAHVFNKVANAHSAEIEKIFGVKVTVPTLPFPRVTLKEAREILAQKGHHIAVDDDLDPAGERLLGQHFLETQGHDFFFATEYPTKIRAFYHMRSEENPGVTKSFDLMYKGIEITTGAQREHRIDILRQQAAERGLQEEHLQSYFNSFTYGCPPHGGLGLGFGRLLGGMLGQTGITPVTFLPRTMTRLTP